MEKHVDVAVDFNTQDWFEKAKEATRAVNAAKLDRVFARPFVAALEGHCDGITALARSPTRLNSLVSGAADGEVRLWNVPERRALVTMVGHTRAVQGLAVSRDGSLAVSCSDDCTARLWRLPVAHKVGSQGGATEEALMEYRAKAGLRGVDHHWQKDAPRARLRPPSRPGTGRVPSRLGRGGAPPAPSRAAPRSRAGRARARARARGLAARGRGPGRGARPAGRRAGRGARGAEAVERLQLPLLATFCGVSS